MDRGCATPLQVAAQQTPTTGPREEEGLYAVPDPNTWHLVTLATANSSPLIPPHSAGRGWACWDRDEKLSGQEAEKKSGGGIMKLQPRKPTPALGSVREAGVGVRGGGGGDGWGLPAWCAPQAMHPIFRVALIRPRYLAASQSLSVANVQVDWLGLSPRGGGGAVTVTPATWGSLTCSPGWRAVCCSRGCWPPVPASC